MAKDQVEKTERESLMHRLAKQFELIVAGSDVSGLRTLIAEEMKEMNYQQATDFILKVTRFRDAGQVAVTLAMENRATKA